MKWNKKRMLPWVILLIGVILSAILILTKTKAQKKTAVTNKVKLVRVMEVQSQVRQFQIQAHATTMASQNLNISTQVSGQVEWVSPLMTEGAWVPKGQLLFRLDPADYQIRVEQAKAGLAKAEYDLDQVLAQKKIAQEGLESYKRVENKKTADLNVSSLALYGPQIKNAKAYLLSARASVRQAKLHLSRTEVKAPFAGIFRTVNIAVGQVVLQGQSVAGFFASHPVRLKVTLPLAELPWVQIGSKTILVKKIGQQNHRWEGLVTKRLIEIDSLGHMAQVMVEVLNTTSDKGFPLPIGMQLQVDIQGEELADTVAIPLYALRTDDHVWLVNSESRLEIKKLLILRKAEGLAFIEKGIQAGDLLITSNLDGAISGMKIKIYQVMPRENPRETLPEKTKTLKTYPKNLIPERSP